MGGKQRLAEQPEDVLVGRYVVHKRALPGALTRPANRSLAGCWLTTEGETWSSVAISAVA